MVNELTSLPNGQGASHSQIWIPAIGAVIQLFPRTIDHGVALKHDCIIIIRYQRTVIFNSKVLRQPKSIKSDP